VASVDIFERKTQAEAEFDRALRRLESEKQVDMLGETFASAAVRKWEASCSEVRARTMSMRVRAEASGLSPSPNVKGNLSAGISSRSCSRSQRGWMRRLLAMR
jgi:hypothetical protein